MSDIYINEATDKRIKLYRETWVHVNDYSSHRDILDFWDTAEGVAQWCMENLDEDHENYAEIQKAYDEKDWEEVIELEGCRYCDWTSEERWVVEEIA